MNLATLTNHLNNANLANIQLTSPNGGKILVTPHAARVLGLFPDAQRDNIFYTNEELTDPGKTKAMLAGIHLLGGDRLWFAPERGLFFKGNKLDDGGTIQHTIDPGNWVVAARGDNYVRFTTEIDAEYFHIKGSRLRGKCSRAIRSISNPLAGTGVTQAPLADVVARTPFAGYEMISSFHLTQAPSDDLYVGLWFLIQLNVETPGYIYIPVAGNPVVTGDYYEPTGSNYLRTQPAANGKTGHVRFKLDSLERHKIGIRKTEVLGRGAFLSNEVNGKSNLLIRNFCNNPSATYADVPLHSPNNGGTQDSVQCYNHNSGPTGFGEIEFHTPAISRNMPGGQDAAIHDTNQVWSFTGSRADLVQIASYLLNLEAAVFAV